MEPKRASAAGPARSGGSGRLWAQAQALGLGGLWVLGTLTAAENPPLVSLEVVEPVAREAGEQPAQVRVRRVGLAEAPLTVNYTLAGTARNGRDFARLPGSLTLAAGEASGVIEIRPLDDREVEEVETVVVRLAPARAPFTLAILPDTQYYAASRYGGLPEMFTSQTRWIVEHRDEFNIVFVLHEGDATEYNTYPEWLRVKESLDVLEGEVPYALAVGNHDGLTWRSQTALLNIIFPVAEAMKQPTFGRTFEGQRDNCYHRFQAGGLDWLLLVLEFGPRNKVLDWANQVVSGFPDHRVIVLTHAHVADDDTLIGSKPDHVGAPSHYGAENDGPDVWEKFLRRHRNIAFVFNGHVGGDGQGRLVGVGDHGNRVYQMLCNYQSYPRGGDGYMRLIEFHPDEDRLEAWSYSPYTGRRLRDFQNEFAYTGLGVFPVVPAAYRIDPGQQEVVVELVSDDFVAEPLAVEEVRAFGLAREINVRFTQPLPVAAATDPAHYTLMEGPPVRSARLLADERTVVLTVGSPLEPGREARLEVRGLQGRLADPALELAQLAARFVPEAAFLVADFAEGGLGEWKVVDEGEFGGPSSWYVRGGRLHQAGNIYGPHPGVVAGRRGTFAYWSAAGAQNWGDYAFQVTVRSHDDDGVGVLFRYRDPANYYKVELDRQRQFRQLVRVVEGRETRLAWEAGGYELDTDFVLSVEAAGPVIEVTLDGAPLFGGTVRDGALRQGTVALYCWANPGTEFGAVSLTAPGRSGLPGVRFVPPPRPEAWVPGQPTFTLAAEATADPALGISSVTFYQDDTPLARVFEAPYWLDWVLPAPGLYALRARVMDGAGQQLETRSWQVRVEASGAIAFVDAPLTVQLIRSQADQVMIHIPPWPGRSSIIEASTNLVDWEPVGAAPELPVLLPTADPAARDHPQRFYRAMRPAPDPR
ncbi:MAG: metallophosphoesterase [Verrucomicrobiales bacterium]|nr:metallophosphoesterase [Verrucomicrobiales bacterium]